MKIKSTPCIITEDGIVHVPRPTSVNAGLARSVWISKLTGKESRISSPDVWDMLAKKHGVQTLSENEDGSWTMGK